MPVTLTIHAERRPTPVWRLLHIVADEAAIDLRVLWFGLLDDLSDELPAQATRAALASGHLWAVEAVITPVVEHMTQQARLDVPPLLLETVTRATDALLPATEALLGTPVPTSLMLPSPETVQAIEQYAGRQIVAISDTTLQAVRGVLRQGFLEGRSVQQMMRDLEAHIGLTPRQTAAIEKLRERLTVQGQSRARVQAQVEAASRRALRLRVHSIARSESMTAVNMGQYESMQQSIRAGLLDPASVKRFWETAGESACPKICAPIPSMNPEGVGPDEPFQTPVGPLLYPIAHPMCRCTTMLKA